MNILQPNKNLPEEYLDLMKKSLTRYITDDGYLSLYLRKHGKTKHAVYNLLGKVLNRFNLEIVKRNQFNKDVRRVGKDWPATAETMIGLVRLDNIQQLMVEILAKDIKGDFIETGVWRGGATIFMRAVLKAYDIKDRKVWAADSFQGLPKPSVNTNKNDIKDQLFTYTLLNVSLSDVKKNFQKYNLLDGQVEFLVGWFKDTLISAPIKKLSLIRLDGDMYESTMDAITALYPKLSAGGYLIVDDYCLPACRRAIKDFRKQENISDKLIKIDWASVYWKKSK